MSLADVRIHTTQETGGPRFLATGDGELWATLRCRCGGGGYISPFGDIHGVIRLRFGGVTPDVTVIEVPNAKTTGIAVGGGAVWVPNDYGGFTELRRFDPESMTLAETIPLEGGSAGIAFGAGAAWIANPIADTVSRVDPSQNRVVERISVGVHASRSRLRRRRGLGGELRRRHRLEDRSGHQRCPDDHRRRAATRPHRSRRGRRLGDGARAMSVRADSQDRHGARRLPDRAAARPGRDGRRLPGRGHRGSAARSR